jgi:hypothetical protein
MLQDDPPLTPREAAECTRLTRESLAQLRFRGLGPRFLKPTPRVVLCRRSALDAFLQASERDLTGSYGP